MAMSFDYGANSDSDKSCGDISFDDEGKLVSGEFNDFYFSPQGGLDESRHVFLGGNNLPQRFSGLFECQHGEGGRSRGEFVIAEAGFGTGRNFLTTMQLWDSVLSLKKAELKSESEHGKTCAGEEISQPTLIYHSFELYPLEASVMEKIYPHWPDLSEYAGEFLSAYKQKKTGKHDLCFNLEKYSIKLMLWFGDIRDNLDKLPGRVDAWYLDGFAPDRNPLMWSDLVFDTIKSRAVPTTTAATYSCARAVRENFARIGFQAEKTEGFGNKRHMLQAVNSCSLC